MDTITAFIDQTSIGFGRLDEIGGLYEWLTEPTPGDFAPNAEDVDEDGDPLSSTIQRVGASEVLIDMTKADEAIYAAGYRTVGEWMHDGLDGLMVQVEAL